MVDQAFRLNRLEMQAWKEREKHYADMLLKLGAQDRVAEYFLSDKTHYEMPSVFDRLPKIRFEDY